MIIPIPDDCQKIHILFSGGIDSALLCYLLAKQVAERSVRIPIKCYRMKTPVSNTGLILDYVTRKTGVKPLFQEGHKAPYIRNMVRDILAIDTGYVYSGCNKVLEGITPTKEVGGVLIPTRGEPHNSHHLRPLMDLHKGEILNLFWENDIVDLLPLTHSCGVVTFGTPECGACYFCLEKQWGLAYAGLLD